jgi:hypothetical protein
MSECNYYPSVEGTGLETVSAQQMGSIRPGWPSAEGGFGILESSGAFRTQDI